MPIIKKLKDILFKLIFVPLSAIIALVALSTAVLIYIFVNSLSRAPLAPIGYALSFYTLIVLTLFLVFNLKKVYAKAKKRLLKNHLINRFFSDAEFKTKVSLAFTFGVNLIYGGVNILSGIINPSAWFFILAAYYIILAFMRFILLRYFRKIGVGESVVAEHKRAGLCGIIMLLLNLMLVAALLMIIYKNKGYEYNGILIYIMAAYTFFITIQSIINFIKYRKQKSPVMFATKVISLSAALVSMLALETAMLAQFGAGDTSEFRRIIISITGGLVVITELIMSVYLIIHSVTEIKKLKNKVRLK